MQNKERTVMKEGSLFLETVLVNDEPSLQGFTEEQYIEKGFLVLPIEDAEKQLQRNQETAFIDTWEEITEDEYFVALEVLPPKRYESIEDATFFMHSEATISIIHRVFCCYKGRYFSANRKTTTSYKNMLKAIKEMFY